MRSRSTGQDCLCRSPRHIHESLLAVCLESLRDMTIQDVADHLGISWDVIKEIQKADLKRRFDRPKLKHLRHIAIDEISVAKGHRYLTIVWTWKAAWWSTSATEKAEMR